MRLGINMESHISHVPVFASEVIETCFNLRVLELHYGMEEERH